MDWSESKRVAGFAAVRNVVAPVAEVGPVRSHLSARLGNTRSRCVEVCLQAIEKMRRSERPEFCVQKASIEEIVSRSRADLGLA